MSNDDRFGTPDDAYDCNDDTRWNAGKTEGQITADFAEPYTFSAVHITANASPANYARYEIRCRLDNSQWDKIADATVRVENRGGTGILMTSIIPVKDESQTCQHLRIDVDGHPYGNGKKTWASIFEVRVAP